jgi:hypothetical protein
VKSRGVIAAFLLLAGLLLSAPAGALAVGQPAQRLLAHVDRLSWELGLPLEDPGSLNLRGVDSIAEVELVNGDGYRITVLAFGQTVALRVERHSRTRASATTYLARGRATPTSIKASFASLGRVDLRFQRPTGPPGPALFDDCRSRKRGPVLRFGLFAGAIRFRGEGGYTSVATHRVKGISIDFAALTACLHRLRAARRVAGSPGAAFGIALSPPASRDRRAPGAPSVPTHPSNRPRRTILVARQGPALSRTVFAALASGDDRKVRYIAAEAASEGPVGVVRLTTVTAPSSTFSFDGALSRARVSPPLPFTGKGLFEHGAGSEKSWSGPLAVSFLGAPHVPLTGSPFSAELGEEF